MAAVHDLEVMLLGVIVTVSGVSGLAAVMSREMGRPACCPPRRDGGRSERDSITFRRGPEIEVDGDVPGKDYKIRDALQIYQQQLH